MADPKRKWNALLTLAGTVVAAYVAFGAFMIGLGGGWWAVALVPLLAILLWLNQVYRPTGKKLPRRSFRVVLIGLSVLLALSFLVPFLVVPRWIPAITLDGTDPQRTSCADIGDTVVSAQWPMVDADTEAQLATAVLKYSTACDTTWIKLENVALGTRTLTQVSRPAGDWLLPSTPSPEDDTPSEGIAYSKQIRSSGCTFVSVTLMNGGGDVLAELEESNGCNG
ncbi:DUF2690 domain-containing protein [Microbacterium sp. GCS4]|uniref:DUF2690 domain-containing protein n=1 Tax=Microbacterium sp. GCS4 TaxID=1692239 RepID=UPI0006815210|nr:DUF2690 domain-containing protein [Microbacterium sp. GCS4]KNY07885.1 hypothetical protein AKH00_06610 [Microbacterium sp. GCS4]